MRILIQLFGWLLPRSLRTQLYAKAFGWQIGKGSHIGRSLFFCHNVIMGEHSGIGNFNVVRRIDALIIGNHSYICHMNWITGYPTSLKDSFAHVPNRKCELEIGDHSSITSQHFIDCTGGIRIGDFTTVGGVRSQLLTHFIDAYESRQTCKPIHIGNYCFVGTGCLLLPGSGLPNYTVLGGGGILTKRYDDEYALYAGNPAVYKKALPKESVRYFTRNEGAVS